VLAQRIILDGGAYRCHLAYTVERSMLSGDLGCYYHYFSTCLYVFQQVQYWV